MASFPARIHVLLSGVARVGVVIRRGPAKQVCTFLWNRRTDEFRVGQWFKGRIYERRADISPDGKYLIYFAMKGTWNSEAKGSWTAISRAPYLKALAIFPKGDCWNGGGLFTGNKRYWLNDSCGQTVLRDTREVRRDLKYRPIGRVGGECLSVYYPRLLRDGWTRAGEANLARPQGVDVFEKLAHRGWVLRKIAHAEIGAAPGRGCYWDEHELRHLESNASISFPDWEWAEIDHKRLVWAQAGKLFAGVLTRGGLIEEKELFDFNGFKFEAIEAPY
jgi:hypothetical protein